MGLLLREIPQSPQLPSLLPARSLLRVCLCVKLNKLLCPSSAPHTLHVTMNERGSCSSLWPRIITPHEETRVGWLSSAYTGMLCRRVGTLEGEKGQKCVCVCLSLSSTLYRRGCLLIYPPEITSNTTPCSTLSTASLASSHSSQSCLDPPTAP